MARQISWINTKQQVFQFQISPLLFQTLIFTLFIMTASIPSVQSSKCPSSVPASAAMTIEKYSFSSYSTSPFGTIQGPVSDNLYFLYKLSSYGTSAVRKVDASGFQFWVASFEFESSAKSLSVDAVEQSVYFSSFTSPLVVLRLSTTNGSVLSQHSL